MEISLWPPLVILLTVLSSVGIGLSVHEWIGKRVSRPAPAPEPEVRIERRATQSGEIRIYRRGRLAVVISPDVEEGL